jgi:ribosomal-protein-alanine N-acetyltransferase
VSGEARAGYLRTGERVAIRTPTPRDETEFTALAAASREPHHPWLTAPDTPDRYAELLARLRRDDTRGFLVCVRETGAIAGYVMINNIVMRAFRCGYLAYAAFTPGAGRGYLTEGLDLVVRYAFTELGLHRLEANIQPGNQPSRNLVKRLGFRLEGLSPDYLFIDGAWRDHERWAITTEMRA